MKEDAMTDDKIKLIAIEVADEFSQRTGKQLETLSSNFDSKLGELHGRVTDIATDMSSVKTRLSLMPDVEEALKQCRERHAAELKAKEEAAKEQAAKAALSFSQWVKIITLILGFLAAAFGVNWVIPGN